MKNVLQIKGLRVSYHAGTGHEKLAIDNLDLEVKQGEIFGLLGPNGAGKTTLIKSIIGLITPAKGDISLFGGPSSLPRSRQRLGYMPEVSNYYWFMTPGEILFMFGKLSGINGKTLREKIDRTIDIVGLTGQKHNLVRTLSKGMQERLNIAQALLHDPEILVLDEPFSGLDPLGRIHTRSILKKLKEEKKTVLLSSHELSEAELICDTVCIMRDGKVLKYGPLAGLLAERSEHSLENYFINIINRHYA